MVTNCSILLSSLKNEYSDIMYHRIREVVLPVIICLGNVLRKVNAINILTKHLEHIIYSSLLQSFMAFLGKEHDRLKSSIKKSWNLLIRHITHCFIPNMVLSMHYSMLCVPWIWMSLEFKHDEMLHSLWFFWDSFLESELGFYLNCYVSVGNSR